MEPIRCCFERYETKYLITPAQYEAMKRGMAARTAPDAHPRYTISNLYYDTPSFRLIRDSLEKPTYKEKLRLRSYGLVTGDQMVFLEMKKKMNGVVFKRRVDLPLREAMAYTETGARPSAENQILREIDWMRRCYNLRPVVFIGYDREAFSGTEDPELRITFDTNVRWRTTDLDLSLSDRGKPLDRGGKILLEVKFPGVCPFWLSRLLSELDVRRTSISKYGEVYKRALLYRPQVPVVTPLPAAKKPLGRGLLEKAASLSAASL